MILFITLTGDACTPKTKGFINKLLTRMMYNVKYTSQGVAIHDIENDDQVQEIKTVLTPYKTEFVLMEEDQLEKDLMEYNNQRYEN
jgi:hypothetical protein